MHIQDTRTFSLLCLVNLLIVSDSLFILLCVHVTTVQNELVKREMKFQICLKCVETQTYHWALLK